MARVMGAGDQQKNSHSSRRRGRRRASARIFKRHLADRWGAHRLRDADGAAAILQESFLSSGIASRPPMPSGGNLAAEGAWRSSTRNKSTGGCCLFPVLVCCWGDDRLALLNFVGRGSPAGQRRIEADPRKSETRNRLCRIAAAPSASRRR